MGTVEHPRIRPETMEEREYQRRIADRVLEANTLVVLPTGLGKTTIALRAIAEALRAHPTRSVLFLAPTRPLVVQHGREVARTLLAPPPVVLTGAVAPSRRPGLLHPPQVIVATPQVIARDLVGGSFPIETLSLAVFDEAHRAVGEYPYVAIAEALRARGIRILALTASPGSRRERILEVWRHLGIERFELRTPTDPDVAPYFAGIVIEPVTVPLPTEVQHLIVQLRTVVGRQGQELQRLGFAPPGSLSRRDLLDLGEQLDRAIAAAKQRGDTQVGSLWGARTVQAIALKASHAVELIESQGVDALRQYLHRQRTEATFRRSPALRGFLTDPDVIDVERRLASLELEHPKLAKATEIVREELERHPEGRAIVFTQYRQSADRILEELERHGGPQVHAARFVGQASHPGDPGMSQAVQTGVLDRFRQGGLNCLVATSVAEEGLDIPSTDLVVLYEPIPDEIRTIQRRGRTGRARLGRAVVLIAEGTRDVGLWRSAVSRERRMAERLEEIQREIAPGAAPSTRTGRSETQRTLMEYGPL
ncbi:MAG: DEAD/DEAH box helicase [Thermoplasmata archaeon]|nr:DEAD/DEAH box helicase [Thermoplasmata archaeon]